MWREGLYFVGHKANNERARLKMRIQRSRGTGTMVVVPLIKKDDDRKKEKREKAVRYQKYEEEEEKLGVGQ